MPICAYLYKCVFKAVNQKNSLNKLFTNSNKNTFELIQVSGKEDFFSVCSDVLCTSLEMWTPRVKMKLSEKQKLTKIFPSVRQWRHTDVTVPWLLWRRVNWMFRRSNDEVKSNGLFELKGKKNNRNICAPIYSSCSFSLSSGTMFLHIHAHANTSKSIYPFISHTHTRTNM